MSGMTLFEPHPFAEVPEFGHWWSAVQSLPSFQKTQPDLG